MSIRLHPIDPSIRDALYEFEVENRVFFERALLPRGDHYYNRENFDAIFDTLVDEHARKEVGMYVIFNEADELVGRINLTDIAYGPFCKAEVGYRIGERHQGKRHATQALALAVNEAKTTFGLHRLEAGTSPANIGSQIVLLKNGFQIAGRYTQCIQLHGKWEDGLLFERILD